jgi:hypothetical protein
MHSGPAGMRCLTLMSMRVREAAAVSWTWTWAPGAEDLTSSFYSLVAESAFCTWS